MSEVKLHKVSVGATAGKPDGWFRIIPATTAEIMEAHPICSVCNFIVHVSNEHVGDCWKCNNTKSSCFDRRIKDPTADYCRHWEAKP